MQGLRLADLKTKVDGALGAQSQAMGIVQTVASFLPSRKQQKFIDAMKFGAIGAVYSLIKGRKLTTGEYVLGERYLNQILKAGVKSRNDVTDQEAHTAKIFFTVFFGVRIRVSADLDSLDGGVQNYYNQTKFKDVPLKAVERAVYLKKQYYPMESYNKGAWDLRAFETVPYQDLIVGIEPNTLMNIELGETLKIKDGNILGVTNFTESPYNAAPIMGVPIPDPEEESFRDGEVDELPTVDFVHKIKKPVAKPNYLRIIIGIIGVLILAGGAFYGIRKYRNRKKKS